MPMWLYFFVIYFCGIWAFSSSRKHLLITLLSLECVVFYIFLYFFICVVLITAYFLVFSVCEGSLGVSVLVSVIRSHGNDYFQSYGVLQC